MTSRKHFSFRCPPLSHEHERSREIRKFQQGDLLINGNDKVEIYMDANDCRGVSYAANALVKDIRNVSGSQATITSNRKATILVGTIGHSAAIDQLVKQKRINGNLLKGKREKFIITVVDNQLVITGSDRRGTIYGIYELSQQMGVSPWYDWADVPVEHHDSIFVNRGTYTDGEPAVRYRGIFLNDEALSHLVGQEHLRHRIWRPPLLPARLRTGAAPQGQHDVASHVGLGVLCRRCGEREDRR